MQVPIEEVKYEKRHLDETISIIKDIVRGKNIDNDSYRSDIVSRKRFLWEHKNEFIDADLYSLMNEEDLNVDIVNRDILKVYKLYRSMETPYFCRIDFDRENQKKETFYIGLTGVDRDYDPLIYDWRAPVANLYYNYGLGVAEYESEEGVVKGKTVLKRQFDIKLGKLESMYDNELGVNDAILESVLSENTNEQMKNIVDTIQKEQNEIIRSPLGADILVEGVAGSGKTSVALHRIAYLLYNQKNLSNQNILIFSPSEIFTEYISSVLPELGEENVATTTYIDFVRSFVKRAKLESLSQFIERVQEKKDDSRIGELFSRSHKVLIDRFLDEYYRKLKFTKKIGLKNLFISAKELNDMKDSIPSKLSFRSKLERLSEKVCEKFLIDESQYAGRMESIIEKTLKVEKDPLKIWELFAQRSIDEVLYEETTSLLYLYFEIVGYPSMGQIKLVVIDEAQDYSLWQFELLKKIFNGARFTILGDRNQSINPYLKYESLDEISDVIKGSKYYPLKNTYRSSREIVEYTSRILNLKEINSIRKYSGIPVLEKEEVSLRDDLLKDLEFFKEKCFKRVAIITKDMEEKGKIEEIIDGAGVEVIPVHVAKGLEYDAVIVYTDKQNRYSVDEKNLLYVASSRALHALIVYNQ